MTIKSIECGECGETVPYGRLACPSCGALLAAVAGAPPTGARVIETASAVPEESDASSMTPDAPGRAPAAARTRSSAAAPVQAAAPVPAAAPTPAAVTAKELSATAPRSKARASQPVATAAAAPAPAVETRSEPAAAVPRAAATVPPDTRAGVPGANVTTTEAPPQVRYLLEPAADAPPPATWLADGTRVGPAEPAEPDSPWPPLLTSESGLVARQYGWSGSPGVAGTAVPPPVPGAYLPPDAPAAPAMALAGGPLAGAVAASVPSSDPTAAARLRIRDAFVGLDHGRLVEISGWFVLVGSAMTVLGFFLPWSMVVIGAGGTGGYLDDWGLASPTHLLVLLGLLAVLGLGVVQSPVPPWLRTGVLGLTFGGLLIGLLWPYAVGPLGADIGAMVTVLGGVTMLVGGVVASWATRHEEPPPAV